jgi:hypothetical protein
MPFIDLLALQFPLYSSIAILLHHTKHKKASFRKFVLFFFLYFEYETRYILQGNAFSITSIATKMSVRNLRVLFTKQNYTELLNKKKTNSVTSSPRANYTD